MFNLDQSLTEWRRQMLAAGIKTPAPLEELELHLRDEIDRQIKSGLGEAEAFQLAAQKIGPAPALQREFKKSNNRKIKRALLGGLLLLAPMFVVGAGVCYFWLLPATLASSQVYSHWLGFSANAWNSAEYLRFVTKFLLGTGLGFEMPVVILVLVKIGLLNYERLCRCRRYVIVFNLILGALLTTPEIITQLLLALPLQALYEVSVLIVWHRERWDKQRRKQA